MVEVDPMILVAAGSIAAGLAAAVMCMRPSSKVTKASTISDKSEVSNASKPKKKHSKPAKKSTASSNESPVQSEESEIAAIIADLGPIDLHQKQAKKMKEASTGRSTDLAVSAAKKVADLEAAAKKAEIEKQEAEAEIAAALADALLAEEEEKRNKKPKESAEQKTARLERQKIAKMKKAEVEEMSKSVAIELAAAESKSANLNRSSVSTAPAHADGWAVVEDKRKVKAKAPIVSATSASDPSSSDEPAVAVDVSRNEITVDSKKIGSIIGPKGVTLHGIQNLCGVEIQTPKGDRDAPGPVIITITGPAEGVAKATQAINELCTKGYSKMLAPEDFKEGSIEVHPR